MHLFGAQIPTPIQVFVRIGACETLLVVGFSPCLVARDGCVTIFNIKSARITHIPICVTLHWVWERHSDVPCARWHKRWRLRSEHSPGLWNESPATVTLANAPNTLCTAVLCKEHALIAPATTTASSLSATPSSATSFISRIEPARCGRGKWLLNWNYELLDWRLVL